VIDEVEKIELIIGKSVDLGLNEGGMIFNFHNIKSHFLKILKFFIL
jgi:hypothetical protein